MISKTNPLYVKADLLARETYKVVLLFPKFEMYGLSSQLRRAIISVILNIIEGFARQSKKEFRRFLLMSFGSLEEGRYILEFANKQKYFDDNKYNELNKLLDEVAKILWSIINKEEEN
jgi:four helix bundle protein